MENDRGQTRSFLVTHVDDEKVTVDGNNPLSDREVVFVLEILAVRDATDDETRVGGAIPAGVDVDPARLNLLVDLHLHFPLHREKGDS